MDALAVLTLLARVALALVVAVNAWVLVNLLRQNGRLAERVAILEDARRPMEPAIVGLPLGRAAVRGHIGASLRHLAQ